MSSMPLVTPEERLREIQRPCRNCDVNLKKSEVLRCARCKQVQYCSRACQKAHWKAAHQFTCDPPEDGSTPHRDPAVRLAEHIVSNDNLMLLLKRYAVLLLELSKEPKNGIKFAIHVICATRPVEGEMLDGRQKVMFYLKEIERVPIDDAERRFRQPLVKKSLKAFMEHLDQIGDTAPPIVFFFTNEEGGPAVIVTTTTIPPSWIEDMESTINTLTRKVSESDPYKIFMVVILDRIRTVIENDTANELKLRRYLPRK
ncbi:hypothetical protein BOTBODRAFT_37979 [Botryobasidium botryosum FD-172 SS1]|uniref:MYND-type domain-containing protein n=1 Tax=Botryobasidium botryosum (strain FD-172 SS1) TaxID=930990 RepID=A0A067M987_BOTB1|nr:hypothetical protein BOTBODRAFT_37979 [Botryobasidium botryosum FD-172 SS1]